MSRRREPTSEGDPVEHLDEVLGLLDVLYDAGAYDTLRPVIAVTTVKVECPPRGRGKRRPTHDAVAITFRDDQTLEPFAHGPLSGKVLSRPW